MPILKRGLEIFPQALFELRAAEYPWWVAHVRSRQEKALVRYLEPLHVPFYLPFREQKRRRAGRTFRSYLPLFPGYVFLRGGEHDRVTALKSNLLVRVIPVPDQALLDAELAQLNALRESGASFYPCTPIEPGDPVRITDGPFRGYSGVVLRHKGGLRLIVTITMLRKAVLVELEREAVASTGPAQESLGGRRTRAS
jgi:transcriptional antiterminator RfaH